MYDVHSDEKTTVTSKCTSFSERSVRPESSGIRNILG